MVIRLLALMLLLVSGPSVAANVGVQVDLNPIVPLGEKPTLNVVIKDRLTKLVVDLVRSDGAKIQKVHKAPRKGTRVRFPLTQPEGTQHYTGSLSVHFANGFVGKIPLEFDASVQGPLKITVADDGLNTETNQLTMRVSRPCVRVAIEVMGLGGRVLSKTDERFDTPQPAEHAFVVPLLGVSETILKVGLTAYDEQGFYQSIDLFPWKVAIPHEDVIFASGKHQIDAAERPKLDAAIKLIQPQVRIAARWAPIKLYVIGHTDTVGPAADNRALSQRRARSIANYLKKRGELKIPVRVTGLGEDRPAVETGDEVDEARNRRAEYFLAIQPPIQGVNWQ